MLLGAVTLPLTAVLCSGEEEEDDETAKKEAKIKTITGEVKSAFDKRRQFTSSILSKVRLT
jgi:hypothetical protein